MESRQHIEETLRSNGLRVTLPRVAVLEFLSGTAAHPTAEEVGAAVNRLVPKVSRASIYNVLHSLKEVGLVKELVLDDAVARFDANIRPHHHFICRECARVEDVDFGSLPLGEPRRPTDGRTIEGYAVVMHGLCPGCAAK